MPDRYVQPTGVDVTNPSPTTPPPTAPLVYSPLVEPINTVAAAGAAQTLPDPTAGSQPQSVNRLTLTAANCAADVSRLLSAGKSMTLVLIQDATGGRTCYLACYGKVVGWHCAGSVDWCWQGGLLHLPLH
jgi:hypothetical protein